MPYLVFSPHPLHLAALLDSEDLARDFASLLTSLSNSSQPYEVHSLPLLSALPPASSLTCLTLTLSPLLHPLSEVVDEVTLFSPPPPPSASLLFSGEVSARATAPSLEEARSLALQAASDLLDSEF